MLNSLEGVQYGDTLQLSSFDVNETLGHVSTGVQGVSFSRTMVAQSGFSLIASWILHKLSRGQSLLLQIRHAACSEAVIRQRQPPLAAFSEFLLRVDSLVPDEVRLLAEGLAALNADVGLLPRVFPHVEGERGDLGEGFTALAAVEGLLARVAPYVDGQGRALGEGFPALVTLVGLLAGVAPHVHDKGGSLRKGFSTLIANVGLLPRVAPHM